MPIEKTPKTPVERDSAPAGHVPYRVMDGDTWESVAARHGVSARNLMNANFRTTNFEEINWYLHHYVGCNLPTEDGKNWRFSLMARPGRIYTPTKQVEEWPNSHDCFWTREELNSWYVGRMMGTVRSLTDFNYKRWHEIKFYTKAFYHGTKFLEWWDYFWDYGTPRLNPHYANTSPTINIRMMIVNERKNKFQALYDWTKQEEARFQSGPARNSRMVGPGGIRLKQTAEEMKRLQDSWDKDWSLESPISREGKQVLEKVYREAVSSRNRAEGDDRKREEAFVGLLEDLFTQKTRVVEGGRWGYRYLKPEELKGIK